MNKVARYHLSEAADIAGAIYGAAAHLDTMMTASGDGAIPEHYNQSLTGVFAQSSVALLIRFAASELINRIDWVQEQDESPPPGNEIAGRVTSTAGDGRDENDADKFADGEHCRDEV